MSQRFAHEDLRQAAIKAKRVINPTLHDLGSEWGWNHLSEWARNHDQTLADFLDHLAAEAEGKAHRSRRPDARECYLAYARWYRAEATTLRGTG